MVRCALSENSRPDDAGFHLFFTGLGPGLKFLGTVKMRRSVGGEGVQGDTENEKKKIVFIPPPSYCFSSAPLLGKNRPML